MVRGMLVSHSRVVPNQVEAGTLPSLPLRGGRGVTVVVGSAGVFGGDGACVVRLRHSLSKPRLRATTFRPPALLNELRGHGTIGLSLV